MFAPHFHPAFKHALAPRREIGIRTVFNILGPLTNPAHARRYLQGAPTPAHTELMAWVHASLGADRVFVVHGQDGMDEISICAPTQVSEVHDGTVRTYTLSPEDLGFTRAPLAAVHGGSPDENAEICVGILQGQPGPRRDIVLMNAGAALVAAGIAGTIPDGVTLAVRSIDSGAAYAKLEALRLRTKFA
jgi:anthranilate phosphoribosyltransferase